MKKFTFGTPEQKVPSAYCDGFNYTETDCLFSESDFSFKTTQKGSVLEFSIAPDTKIFGFGLQLYSFDHYGKKVTVRCNADAPRDTGDSHAPVPFFVTNKGWGMYFDTARYAEFYCGVMKPENGMSDKSDEIKLTTEELYAVRKSADDVTFSAFIPVSRGIDVYVIEGKNITDIVSQYNMMSGGGCSVPEWALGVLYRCNGGYNDEQILEVAEYMRENGVPCDILGLEPGWHTHAYSCTYVWNKQRFPQPKKLVDRLIDMGYHINLWEHAFVHPDSPIYNALLPYSADYCVWGGLVPDFSLPEAREIFAGYHKENLTSMGIDGFKADECDGSDYTGGWTFPNHTQFPSGLDGEQYHSLFGALYAKTMMQGLDKKPTMSEIRSMGALGASYPFVLYSDLSNITAFLTGVVNSGFSGILWTPEVRDGATKKELIRRLQMVTFSVQCLINAWSCPEIPWLKFNCVDEVKQVLSIRKALVPELKKAFDRYKETGVPPVRALVMDYTDDENTYNICDEYLFCEDMLVAPFTDFESDTREIYLPEGEWEDFFTGEKYKSGRFSFTSENIPVFRRTLR
ncbi:MAG: glycoside hydrolase [Clostridia bacterium]|nr:glycoside hydrolase [Clostridia bacterium]